MNALTTFSNNFNSGFVVISQSSETTIVWAAPCKTQYTAKTNFAVANCKKISSFVEGYGQNSAQYVGIDCEGDLVNIITFVD